MYARDFDADDWWYRCRFAVPDRTPSTRLRFDGLATIADAWLNGRHILHSTSMFLAHAVDVGAVLAAEQRIAGAVSCALTVASRQASAATVAHRARHPAGAALAPHDAARPHRDLVPSGGAGGSVAADFSGARARVHRLGGCRGTAARPRRRGAAARRARESACRRLPGGRGYRWLDVRSHGAAHRTGRGDTRGDMRHRRRARLVATHAWHTNPVTASVWTSTSTA